MASTAAITPTHQIVVLVPPNMLVSSIPTIPKAPRNTIIQSAQHRYGSIDNKNFGGKIITGGEKEPGIKARSGKPAECPPRDNSVDE